MTQLTESQAWLVIAEAYATEYEDRTAQQIDLTEEGCCDAIGELGWGYKRIPSGIADTMEFKICQCLPPNKGYFCSIRAYRFMSIKYIPPAITDLWRADFCYLMAYACEDE